MTATRQLAAPGTARGRFEVAGFDRMATVEVPDLTQARRLVGDGDFRAHDEDAELLLGEKDRSLNRARELWRSRRLRARRRGLEARATAARGIADQRRRQFEAAGRLLAEAHDALAPLAFRRLATRAYRRRKVIFALGETISLAVAFSAAFDVPPLEGVLLSAGIALAFVVAGDLGGLLRHAADRDGAGDLDPRYRALVARSGRRWLAAAWCTAAALFALAAVSVGFLRATGQGGAGGALAAAMAVLTLTLAVASGVSSWQHANVAADLLDHLELAERRAARAWRRAARARVLRRYDALGERIDVRWQSCEARGEARMHLARALCAWFRARHPQLCGHGVRQCKPVVPANGVAPLRVADGSRS